MPIPYIHFQNDCEKAMRFYADLMNGQDLQLHSYAEMLGSEGGEDRIMHAQVVLESGLLMGSDYPPGQEGRPQQSVSISIMPETVERARQLYDALLEGGAAAMEFGPTFFSPGFGMVKDRFGTHWMIMVPGNGPS